MERWDCSNRNAFKYCRMGLLCAKIAWNTLNLLPSYLLSSTVRVAFHWWPDYTFLLPSTQDTDYFSTASVVCRVQHISTATRHECVAMLHYCAGHSKWDNVNAIETSLASRSPVVVRCAYICVGSRLPARHSSIDPDNIRSLHRADNILDHSCDIYIVFGQYCRIVAESQSLDSNNWRSTSFTIENGSSRGWLQSI